MSETAKDFLGKLPSHLGTPGARVPVPIVPGGGSLPQLTLEQENAATMQRFRAMQEARAPSAGLPGPQRFPLPVEAEAQDKLQSAREMLRAAIGAAGVRQSQYDHAANVLRVGRESVTDLQSRLETANGVDAEIAKYLAAHVGDELPPALVERRVERDRLRQKATDAAAAAQVLEQHAEAAGAHLRAAQAAVQSRVQDVLAHHLEIVGARLMNEEAATLRDRRTIIDLIDAGARPPATVQQVLHETRVSEDRSAPAVRAARLQKWRNLMDKLAIDSDVEIAIDP